MSETLVRLTWPWRLIAPALALVAAAYPFLVTQVELRSLDLGDLLPPLLVFGAALAYWWYSAHSAVATEHAVVFRSPFRTRTLRWGEVVEVEVTTSWVIARDTSGGTHRVSTYAQHASSLADALRKACATRGRG